MTEQDKSEIVGLMSDVMQKFANEYMQPQFDALRNAINTKSEDLKQDIAELRTALKDTRQELKFEIKKLQKDSDNTTQDVESLMSWKRDLTAACNIHQESGGAAFG